MILTVISIFIAGITCKWNAHLPVIHPAIIIEITFNPKYLKSLTKEKVAAVKAVGDYDIRCIKKWRTKNRALDRLFIMKRAFV